MWPRSFVFWPMTRMCVLSLWRLWSPPLWPVLFLPPLVLLFCPPMPNEQWTQVVLNSEHVIGGEENLGAKFDDVAALLRKIDQTLPKRQRTQAFPKVTKSLKFSTRCAHSVILWYNATSIKADKTAVIKKVFPHAKATLVKSKTQQQD